MGAAPRVRAEKNRALFDDAGGRAWELIVYGPVHAGWRFASIGGRAVLRHVARQAARVGGRQVLELCCGVGDTCCWLAGHAPLRVTGVEVNARQVAHARRNLRVRRPEARGRVRIVHADVLCWTPDRAYDVVFAMDSLMYLPGRRQVLERAWSALRPGGALVLAEVTAGHRMTPEVRRRLWDEEGVAELPTPAEQAALLAGAGFTRVRARDLTARAVECFATMCRAQREHRHELRALGDGAFADPVGNERQRRWFAGGTLRYTLATALRPGSAQSERRQAGSAA